MKTLAKMAAVAIVSTAFIVSGLTARAATMSPIEQAELQQLSPALRQEVETRMAAGGQTVQGIVDTILLNEISLEFASGRIVATDFHRGLAVVEGPGGQPRTFAFDVVTLKLRK